jgi:hypothetical protein
MLDWLSTYRDQDKILEAIENDSDWEWFPGKI